MSVRDSNWTDVATLYRRLLCTALMTAHEIPEATQRHDAYHAAGVLTAVITAGEEDLSDTTRDNLLKQVHIVSDRMTMASLAFPSTALTTVSLIMMAVSGTWLLRNCDPVAIGMSGNFPEKAEEAVARALEYCEQLEVATEDEAGPPLFGGPVTGEA